jgi:aspartate/methionine/tyrosine aminotransferase
MRALPEFRLISFLAAHERRARFVLSSSYAEPMALRELLELAGPEQREAFYTEALHYPPHRGSDALRAAIAATYAGLEPSRTLAFAGADEALFVAFQALLGADDHAIVLAPCYQSLEAVPRSLAAVDTLPMDAAGDFALDLDRLARLIRRSTRLVVLGLPHMPTGTLPDRATLDALVALCRRHGIWLLGDEVYRGSERDPADRLPQVADLYERGLSINVLSKAMGLPGVRIGWAACPDLALIERMAKLKHYLSVCNAAPAERLAVIALQARDAILARARSLAEANLALLDAFFRRHAERFDWRVPAGGLVGFPRLREGDADGFAQALLADQGVLVVPGSVYRTEDGDLWRNRFRIGFGRAGLAPALDAFDAFLRGGARP